VPQEWALDTGNRGEGFAWRHHLLAAGLDPDQNRTTHQVAITAAVGGKITLPCHNADLWLVSNLPGWAATPYRILLQRAGSPRKPILNRRARRIELGGQGC
jgi:hypothetical protein